MTREFFIGKTVVPLKAATEHSHGEDEIILNLCGTGHNIVNGQEIPFYPGSILFVPAGCVHFKTADERFQDIFIRAQDLAVGTEPVSMEDDEMHSIRGLMEILHYRYYLNDRVLTAASRSILSAVIGLIRERAPLGAKDRTAAYLQCEIIRRFTDPDFSLEELMRGLPYCVDYTRRIFREAYGVNPKEYVTKLRLERAAELLKEGNISVSDAALASGYYDASYFSRVFRSANGMTPEEYRRRNV